MVKNFVKTWGGGWGTLWEEVESTGRTDEDMEEDKFGFYTTATAKVHLVVKNEVVIGDEAFRCSKNLRKVTATCASEVGSYAFSCCDNLTEAILPKPHHTPPQCQH